MNGRIEIEFAVEIEVDDRHGYIVVGRNSSVGLDDASQLVAMLRSRADTENIFTLEQFLNNVAANNRDVKNLVVKAYHDVLQKYKLEKARRMQSIRLGESPRSQPSGSSSFLAKLIATGLIWTKES